ncbi:hypothetical protein QFC19_008868 [Naganishia cerealis]|uniref:Uncharacterized protein n=1 Tax=Naganishia cerealis TaxID=610337 RepID=A0ACC2UYP1_9TREE|nr:hypothetical protein QFC19_008868 [Naganishia cerealis]
MWCSRVAILIVSYASLYAFASPFPQVLPPFEGITLPPAESTTTYTEPRFTVQTSTPTDDATYPAPTSICTGEYDPGYPTACEPDGIVTIQTSRPDGKPTTYPVITSICTGEYDPGYPTACEPDGTMTIQTSMLASPFYKGISTAEPATETSTSSALDAYPTGDTQDDDEHDIEWCDGDATSNPPRYGAPSTSFIASATSPSADYHVISATSSGYLIISPPTPKPTITRIYPVRSLIGQCLQADDEEPTDGTRVVISACDYSISQQDWEVVPAQWYPPGDSAYIKLAGTNYCLDASFPVASGTPMKIWTCLDGLVQQVNALTSKTERLIAEQLFKLGNVFRATRTTKNSVAWFALGNGSSSTKSEGSVEIVIAQS